MQPRRKVVTYIAASADGYIARADGSVDFLERPRPKGNYGMAAFLKSIDTILWGRKTYDQSLAFGGTGMFGAAVRNCVFTHRPAKAAEGVEFVNQAPEEFLARWRSEPGKNAWMMGGANLIGAFLDAGAIDEFIIHVIPIMIGEGIPLIPPARRTLELQLLSAKRFPDGVVRLHYSASTL